MGFSHSTENELRAVELGLVARTKAHGAVLGGRLGAAVGLGPLVLGPAREERGECAVIYFDKKD